MTKPNVLILCDSNPNNDPRPNRMISWLKADYNLTVISETSDTSIQNIEMIGIYKPTRKNNQIIYFLQYIFYFLLKRYEEIAWLKLGYAKEILKTISKRRYHLIISHDCTFLPFAYALKKATGTKILFDAREYYTRDFEDQIVWRWFRKPIFDYLCQTYLKHCDKVITVSKGLADEYAREYQIPTPEMIMSLPYPYLLEISQTEQENIRIIYHGAVNASRNTELMIMMMDYVDERYSLDLMIVPTSDMRYWRKLEAMVSTRKNIRIIPPVPMQEIVPFINQYDIGLFLCPPTNFNLEYVLPNKLFEFIQARLAVAIGPNVEMKKIVEQYECGIVTNDFDPLTMAMTLNQLTKTQILNYKKRSHQAALELNADKNKEKIYKILKQI